MIGGETVALGERLLSAMSDPTGDGRASREAMGRLVREVWVRWAIKHPSPKGHWLLSFDDLDEMDKEVDRQIGEELASFGAQTWLNANRFLLRDILAALPPSADLNKVCTICDGGPGNACACVCGFEKRK